jgi:uncharacterized membrane protein HdeD (DUF308 family)
MSTEQTVTEKAVSWVRILLGVGGAISLIVGLLILIWPDHTGMAVAAFIAVWAIVGGLVYAGVGVFSKSKGGWARTGHLILGVLYVAVGVIALLNLGAAAAFLALLLGIIVGAVWLVDGIMALSLLKSSANKGWTVFYAVVSIIAGIVLLFSPLAGGVLLWWLFGITLVVMGIIQIVRALRFSPLA